MESTRNMMLTFFIAAILVVSTHAQCDEAAATTCATDFSATFSAAASNLNAFCAGGADAVIDALQSCVNSAVATCEQQTKDMYVQQVPLITGPVHQACAAFNGGDGGGSMGGDNGGIAPCFIAMGTCFGSLQGDLQTIGSLFSPGQPGDQELSVEERNEQQKELCMTLADVDFDQIRQCLEEANCADFNMFGDEPGAPAITTSAMLDFMEGVCDPGCDNYPTKFDSLQQCQDGVDMDNADIDSASCGDIDTYFTCVRGRIGECDALRDFTGQTIQGLIVQSDIDTRCPDVNLSLQKGDGDEGGDPDSASSLKGLLFLVASALFSALFL